MYSHTHIIKYDVILCVLNFPMIIHNFLLPLIIKMIKAIVNNLNKYQTSQLLLLFSNRICEWWVTCRSPSSLLLVLCVTDLVTVMSGQKFIYRILFFTFLCTIRRSTCFVSFTFLYTYIVTFAYLSTSKSLKWPIASLYGKFEVFLFFL